MEKRIEAKGNIIETLEGERFRILELVSESRMSVVYRAERLIEDGTTLGSDPMKCLFCMEKRI